MVRTVIRTTGGKGEMEVQVGKAGVWDRLTRKIWGTREQCSVEAEDQVRKIG